MSKKVADDRARKILSEFYSKVRCNPKVSHTALIKAIAHDYGISPSTVSRIIDGQGAYTNLFMDWLVEWNAR